MNSKKISIKKKNIDLNEINFNNIKYKEVIKYVPKTFHDFIKMYFNKYEELKLGELHHIYS